MKSCSGGNINAQFILNRHKHARSSYLSRILAERTI